MLFFVILGWKCEVNAGFFFGFGQCGCVHGELVRLLLVDCEGSLAPVFSVLHLHDSKFRYMSMK